MNSGVYRSPLFADLTYLIEYDVQELSADKDYLLGLVGGGESGRTVNYIFLWAKFYIIYRQRLFIMAYLMYISGFGNHVIN